MRLSRLSPIAAAASVKAGIAVRFCQRRLADPDPSNSANEKRRVTQVTRPDCR
jgi:hypothetical protein